MGKPIEDFEESTKVHSSAKIDEILRQARSHEGEEVNRDFEDDAEHTRIGPSEELARAMSGGPTPAAMPAVGRVATANIVRRSSAVHLVPRASDQMPSVRASGSIDETPRPRTDDDAFDEWDPDAPKMARAADDEPPSEKVTAKTQPLIERIPAEAIPPPEERSAPFELPLAEPPTRPSVPSIPPISVQRMARPTPMPMPVMEPPKGWPLRWGVIAWAALLAITIGVGSVAYVKINRLERDLAKAKVQLQQERAVRK